MYANNETGILFPVAEAAEIVKTHSNALFHTDAVNAAGKIALDVRNTGIDLLSLSAHKFHGPKGIGALYIREGVSLNSIMEGGGQERGKRPGTEPVHQIAGMGAAAEFVRDMAPMSRVRELRNRLEESILSSIPNVVLNGTDQQMNRLPNTSNISFVDTNGEAILARLDDHGIFVSTGSACNSESHRSSPVLEAMNVPFSHAMGSIRFSLGRFNTEEEIDTVLEKLPAIVSSLRSMAA
jgi:cysteine desulfurase